MANQETKRSVALTPTCFTTALLLLGPALDSLNTHGRVLGFLLRIIVKCKSSEMSQEMN